MYKEVKGDLIKLALDGKFDVIAHGCNCFCTMGAGLAPQMAKAFGADTFKMEAEGWRGDINKLGTIDYEVRRIKAGKVYHMKSLEKGGKPLAVINAYTQYGFGMNHKDGNIMPISYEALSLCLRKINHIFAGKKVGLPQIGCGLAGGDWEIIKNMIKEQLDKCEVTVVIFEPLK